MAESNPPGGRVGEEGRRALEFLSQLCLGLLGDLGKRNPFYGPQFCQRCNDMLHLSGSGF